MKEYIMIINVDRAMYYFDEKIRICIILSNISFKLHEIIRKYISYRNDTVVYFPIFKAITWWCTKMKLLINFRNMQLNMCVYRICRMEKLKKRETTQLSWVLIIYRLQNGTRSSLHFFHSFLKFYSLKFCCIWETLKYC